MTTTSSLETTTTKERSSDNNVVSATAAAAVVVDADVAGAVADVDDHKFLRERHIAYFAQVLDPTKSLPIVYSKLDTNRLTLVHFAVHALDMLGVWESDEIQLQHNLSKSAIQEWIYRLQLTTKATTSSLSSTTVSQDGDKGGGAGFQGGPYVGSCATDDGDESAAVTVNAYNMTTEYHQSHIAMTYTALCTLQALHVSDGHKNMFWEEEEEENNNRLDIPGILFTLTKLQRSDGSFQCTVVPSESDMRFLYCACAICYILKDFTSIDVELAVSYIKSCRSYDGSIALIPGQEGHGGSTFCAIAALQLLNRLDVLEEEKEEEVVDSQTTLCCCCWKDQLIQWCVHRQVCGMQGRPNKAEDTCYSYWIGGTLHILGCSHLLDNSALRSFIFQCQHTKLGGFAKVIGSYPDVLHSFYSLAWLSLSNNHHNSNDDEGNGDYNNNNDNDDNGGKYRDNRIDDRGNVTRQQQQKERNHLPINKLNCTLGIRQKCAVPLFDRDVGPPLP